MCARISLSRVRVGVRAYAQVYMCACVCERTCWFIHLFAVSVHAFCRGVCYICFCMYVCFTGRHRYYQNHNMISYVSCVLCDNAAEVAQWL